MSMYGLEWPDVPRQVPVSTGMYASAMESTRMEIKARHCIECGRTTPHEVHFMIERSPRGVTSREIGEGCTRCRDAHEPAE